MPARLRLVKATGGAGRGAAARAGPDPGGPGPGRPWSGRAGGWPPGTVLAGHARPGTGAVEVGERLSGGRRRVRLLADPAELLAACGTRGPAALHPRAARPTRSATRRSTPTEPGSVAAPTAGLHLTDGVLDALPGSGAAVHGRRPGRRSGHLPARSTGRRVEDHVMHTERYRVPAETMAACRQAERVVAVGTTTVRALETAAATGELEGESACSSAPASGLRWSTSLMTNFHLPRSSLLVLLEAFCGPRWRSLYDEALPAGVPLPVVRRRHDLVGNGTGAGWGKMGTAVVSDGPPDQSSARRRLWPAPAWCRPREGRSPPRASCPSAPAGRGAAPRRRRTSTRLGPQVVLANTYHLMLRPGAEVVEALGGLHRFTGWDGHLLTDSGGFQVFSLKPRIDDDGVTFRSVYDGSSHRLTPEAGGGHPGPPGRRHPDGPRHLLRLAGARGRDPPGRGPDPGLGRPGPRCPPATATSACSGSSRAASTPTSGPSTPAPPRPSTSTATASAGCRWANPASSCWPPWPPPWPSCRSTGPATSWGSATRSPFSTR